jgi:predicted amino acid-binding ACT domain protein
MKQFATVTVIGRDKTGVIARVTNFLFDQKVNLEALEEQVARGQQIEAVALVKAVKLYPGKRLDVYWGVVKEV